MFSSFVVQLHKYFGLAIVDDETVARTAARNFTACLVWEYAARDGSRILDKETLSRLLKSLTNSIACQIKLQSVQRTWESFPELPAQQDCISICTICLREATVDWLQSACDVVRVNFLALNTVNLRARSQLSLDRVFETLDLPFRAMLWTLLDGSLYDDADRRLGYTVTYAYQGDQLKQVLERDAAKCTINGMSTKLCILGALGLSSIQPERPLDQALRQRLEYILDEQQLAGLKRYEKRRECRNATTNQMARPSLKPTGA